MADSGGGLPLFFCNVAEKTVGMLFTGTEQDRKICFEDRRWKPGRADAD